MQNIRAKHKTTKKIYNFDKMDFQTETTSIIDIIMELEKVKQLTII